MLLSVEIPNFPKTILTMMTQDRAALGITAPTSPRNLNPTAPAFHQNQAAPFSPQNLNPSAPVFHHSPTGDRSLSEGIYTRTEAGQQVLLTNGDISANSTNYLVSVGGGMLREASPQSQLAHQIQSSMSMGLNLVPHPMGAGSISNHQPGVSAVTQQQAAYAMAIQDTSGSQRAQKHPRTSNQNSPYIGNGESPYENPSTVALGGDEETPKDTGRAVESEGAGGRQEYPEEVLAPIIKQMQFYFSNGFTTDVTESWEKNTVAHNENLPNDKFLNQHMDMDKYIPLELFLDFGRIKPICNSVDQLTKAVESSSILELSEDRKRVRVSQCRKTLTLRGFPQSATEEDVRQFIVEMGAHVPTHIEFVMFKEKYSVWYVSFKDETAALDSFRQFHNQRAVYKGHAIGCCIKSSGTLAAAGYFPSTEESNQRRMAYQNQVATAVPAPVHAVQNPMPQPQQPPALIQPFSAMQLHSYLPGSAANIYYQQTPQGSYMPYMAGMIHGWPGPTSPLEPGLIMQNNGLQPQHIRAPMPRAHMMPPSNVNQHRFNSRPQRTRQNNVENNTLERPGDRSSIVSVSGPSRSSPLIADSNAAATVISQGAYVPRRTTVQEDIPPPVIPQPQFVAPLVQQQQQHAATTVAVPTAIVNPSGLESVAVPHYQALPHHHHHPQHHQHSIMVQTDTATAPPPPTSQITSNPPPSTQQMHHHHHHNQPPPLVPQHHHHQQQQQPQPPHQQHQTSQSVQHSNQNHHHFNQSMPPLLQPHHQQQHPTNHNQHHQSHQQQHNMVSPYHHHHSQQQHHQYVPPKVHHQQFPPGNRNDKRNRRKKDDNTKNHRGERGQSNRANFSSQALAAADNFTMEANSFPPLPGVLSSISNSEVSHESKMSDIVRGISRISGIGNSNIPRAPSSTPSPVATPAPTSVALGTSTGQVHGLSASVLVDDTILDNGDLALDDDVTSSSQEEVDADINNIFESRSIRSEQQSMSSAVESPVFPSQLSSRPHKVNAPPAAPPAAVLAPRQTENRQGSAQVQGEGKGPQPSAHNHHQRRQSSPTAINAVVLTSEAPKLSYAQILAHKNREASNNACSGENLSSGGLTPNPSLGTNESNLAHDGNNGPLTGGNRTSAQSTNAFREHGNYQGGQPHGPRSSQRGSSKDGVARSEGPPSSSRQPSGSRRNSKENRTWNKFERRKPDTRQN